MSVAISAGLCEVIIVRVWCKFIFFLILFFSQGLSSFISYLLCGQIHTTSQSSPTQAYTQAINDLDKELEYLKQAFEVCFWYVQSSSQLLLQWFVVVTCKEQNEKDQFNLISTIKESASAAITFGWEVLLNIDYEISDIVLFDLQSLINMNALSFSHPIEIEILNLDATMTLDSDLLTVYML